ncbi:MAG: metallophosphoesterase [Pseudomonadota bacterium]
MIRVAAVGDVHVGEQRCAFQPGQLETLAESADLLLLAGDLTQHGRPSESQRLADELRASPVPVVAVLGNHDYHEGDQQRIRGVLEEAGVIVLQGEAKVFTFRGVRVGVAGTKGFGGGFPGACGSEFGEEEMKIFVRRARAEAEGLADALKQLECDVRIALLHYAPCDGTLAGERLEIFPFLGSYFLGEAVDAAGCAVAFHGHAHAGTERALTAGGIPVRNVARPVIKLAYKVYTLEPGEGASERRALRADV